ncbi:MAG: hypothetical protein IT184_03835 [Acidobacteria bacterium]|nr:hypothetical protein [Acidobacteriota bacterium]
MPATSNATRTIVSSVTAAALCAAGATFAAPQNPPSAASASQSEPFRGRGNEPFWSVEVVGTMMTFKPADGATITASPVAVEQMSGGRRYVARAAGQAVATVTVLDQPCTDSMSGQPFPSRVTVQIGAFEARGCGGAGRTETGR